MPVDIRSFSDEETRVLANLEQQYEVWIEAERALGSLAYNLKWKTVRGKDYLYEVIDRVGNAKSLGPRSAANEEVFERYHAEKVLAAARRNGSRSILDQSCRLYRALRLPMIPSEAAEILRKADRRSLLGSHLLVIGTNAVPAYFIEAGGRIINATAETNDFDMAWSASEADAQDNPVWAMLKSIDSTYTVKIEKTFQPRNAKAYEVELLVAPSRVKSLGRNAQPRPAALDEQEWLLNGRLVGRVVVARDGTPARLVVPDPRWFALQKIWMSQQEKRTPLKRAQDERQGFAILDAVHAAMLQFAMDEVFEDGLLDELRPHYARWIAVRCRDERRGGERVRLTEPYVPSDVELAGEGEGQSTRHLDQSGGADVAPCRSRQKQPRDRRGTRRLRTDGQVSHDLDYEKAERQEPRAALKARDH